MKRAALLCFAPRHRRERGAAAIELAVILTLMVAVTVGTVEVGRALYAYDTLAKSTRSATRYYVTLDEPDPSIRLQKTKCMVVQGTPGDGVSCAGTPLLPGLLASMVTIVEPSQGGGINPVKSVSTGALTGPIDLATVSVSGYPFSSIMATIFPDVSIGPISVTLPYVFF